MKKSDLKPGMVVVLRNGSAYMYLKTPKDILLRSGGYLWLSSYDDDLYYYKLYGNSEWDIVEVYKGCSEISLFGDGFDEAIKRALKYEPIWKRSAYTELTLQEIAEKFNIPVEYLRIKE